MPNKQYGLIIPSKQKKPASAPPPRAIQKPSIFDESSDSEQEAPPKLNVKAAPMELSAMQRRMARSQQEKALQEDPTIYQYDEVFDEMEAKRECETKSKEPRKSKYIGRLKECAERRKLENERRIERQVQLEREREGEEFKDKEAFVTAAYRKKLEELRKLDEEEKRDDYLESIGDVTKQSDLDGFYRHLYEQKLGITKEVQKPQLPASSTTTATETSGETKEEGASYQPIRPLKVQQRAYRKRRTSTADDETDDEKKEGSDARDTAKKMHLQNNIDADSDFSIDSSDDDVKSDDGKKAETSVQDGNPKLVTDDKLNASLKDGELKDERDKEAENEENKSLVEGDDDAKEQLTPPPPKRDKSEIWKKRTVGEKFEAAVKRYLERKAKRNACKKNIICN